MRILLPYAKNTLNGFYWPESDQKYKEVLSVRRNSPANFEDIYQGRPGQREGSIFLAADLNAFYTPPEGLEIGIKNPAVATFLKKCHGVLQAWDTAFSTTLQSAYTVCATGALIPCNDYHRGEDPALLGPCESHFDVLLLEIMRKKLDWGDLTTAFKEQYIKWSPDNIILEKKASGISLFQAMESSGLPILAVNPSESKGARATNSVGLKTAGSVQGWFRQHRVLRPLTAPWIPKWLAEMKDFSGADDASSDQVDATVHLVTRAILMGAGMAFLPSGWTPERSAMPANLTDPIKGLSRFGGIIDPRQQMLNVIAALPSMTEDPFYGQCGRCLHFDPQTALCEIQKRRVLALDSCGEYLDAGTEDSGYII